MKLDTPFPDQKAWKDAGFVVPRVYYEDYAVMNSRMYERPQWIHFGAGNLFRAFPAVLAQKLQDMRLLGSRIVAVGLHDGDMIERVYRDHKNCFVAVTLKSDGSIEKRLVTSVGEALRMDYEKDYALLRDLFKAPTLRMASFTITEKSYAVADDDEGFAAGPAEKETLIRNHMHLAASLCHYRYVNGNAAPMALVSMDNCSRNGDKLKSAVLRFAAEWEKRGRVKEGFAAYVDKTLAFPNTMIDKICPGPAEEVRAMLGEAGMEDAVIGRTAAGTIVAPFVNAEEAEYLVIEDNFPNGRPPLEKAGVYFVDRDTVDRAERMKVCACLNPLHTALAVSGCLLGYDRISAEMKNPALRRLVEIIGYDEGLPVASDPGIIRPKDFLDEVINRRLPNPFIPDTPQRIATDSSQKIPIRYGATIKGWMEKGGVEKLTGIPLVFALWLRYLLAVDDDGAPFTPSPDPLLDKLRARIPGMTSILSDAALFGVDLYEAGLGEKVEIMFAELNAGNGAVINTIKKYTGTT